MGRRRFFFSFFGRFNRARYWLFIAIAVPLYMFLLLCFWAYAISVPGAYENGGPTPFPTGPLGIAGALLFFAALIALFVASLAVTVKRLHDRDKAWWWIVPFVFAPNALYGYAQSLLDTNLDLPDPNLLVVLRLVAFALWLWAFVELGCLRGTVGDNRFGPDPLPAP